MEGEPVIRKRDRILLLLKEGPRRYSELARESGMSFEGLSKALKDLVEVGFLTQLPDGRYALTERGMEAVEEVEALLLAKEAIHSVGARAVKEAVKQLIAKRIEEAVTEVEVVETLVRVLRAWATVTGYWLAARWGSSFPTERAGEEERRALSIIVAALRKVGGKQWYKRYAILLHPRERDFLEGEAEDSLPLSAFILEGEREVVLSWVENELAGIKQERLNLLETSLREAILTLLRLIEERKRELEAAPQQRETTPRRRRKHYYWRDYSAAVTYLSFWIYGMPDL